MAEIENKITEEKKEEIINALKVIQDVCKSNNDCRKCCFCDGSHCKVIKNQPCNWIIDNKERWYALL